jgi:hypothetical protein
MARPRKPRKPRPPRQPKGVYRGTAAEGDDLGAAANVVADEARRLASWSRQVSGDINVDTSGDGRTATVWSEAAPAYPNETGARHPVFARGEDREKWTWTAGNNRPFLGPAADAKAGAAMDRYAQKLSRMLKKAGFE